MKLRRVVVGAALVAPLMVGGFVLAREGNGEPPSTGPAAVAPEVVVAEVVTKQLSESAEFTGTLAAVQSVELRPRVGARLVMLRWVPMICCACRVTTSSTSCVERFALMPMPRATLYERLDTRFESMLAAGFLEEVRRLHERADLNAGLPSIRAVGYRQLWQHLEGTCTLAEATEAARRATRNLAKRQLTWLRADPGIQWIRSLEEGGLIPISDALTRACGKLGLQPLC